MYRLSLLSQPLAECRLVIIFNLDKLCGGGSRGGPGPPKNQLFTKGETTLLLLQSHFLKLLECLSIKIFFLGISPRPLFWSPPYTDLPL